VLGMLSLKEGDEAAAEQQLRRSIELGGLDGYAPLGALLVREGRFDEAERVFERGLAATYGDPELRTELANLHLQRGQLRPAAELFGALVGADPYNGLAVVGLAMALTGKVPPDLGQAEALLAGALRRDTRYRDRVLIVLAYVVAQRGDPDCEAEALSLVDAAIEHHPVAEYHLYAARLRAYRGDFRGALRAVGVVQRIAPDDPRAAELGRQIMTYRRDRLRQRLAARRGQYVAAVAAILLAALWTVHLRTGVDTAVLLSVSGFLATVLLVGFLMPNPRVEQFSAGGFRVGAGPPGAPELPPIRTGIPLPALRLSASVLPPAPSAPRKRAVQYTAHGTGIESGLTPRNNDRSA
jgi:tetratricopeptide (TPR) repeat protein